MESGILLSQIQDGVNLGMPHSRPLPSIGARVHELRARDERHNWRIIHRVDDDAILVVDVFRRKTQATPKSVIDACRKRPADYDAG